MRYIPKTTPCSRGTVHCSVEMSGASSPLSGAVAFVVLSGDPRNSRVTDLLLLVAGLLALVSVFAFAASQNAYSIVVHSHRLSSTVPQCMLVMGFLPLLFDIEMKKVNATPR